METHSNTDWELSIGWYSILFYHKEVEFYARTLIIPFDILQHETYIYIFDYVALQNKARSDEFLLN